MYDTTQVVTQEKKKKNEKFKCQILEFDSRCVHHKVHPIKMGWLLGNWIFSSYFQGRTMELKGLSRWGDTYKLHPKLGNINLHNVTHSLISPNPRERMFKFQISLLIVIFLSLVSWNLSLIQTTQEVNPHPCIASCVDMWNVFFFFFFFCHLLNNSACVRHIAQEGQVEWTTPV